ncbi:MAG TPA: alcohol dehydrogenase catalytic domain-containing protein [Gemmatimonadaceae bacterium]|nr:alcohol dehydrogenase catalytic domain-containing protein [Gemmatimonadaceae bacterium]
MSEIARLAGSQRGTRSPATMRAAVLVDVGRIEIRDVPRVAPSPTEVVVRVEAVGLCGTDLHIVAGHANYNRDALGRPRPLATHPQILGHEIAGVVAEVGSEVRDVAVGRRVIVDQGRTCVSERRTPLCEYCESGDSHQCEYYREHGITDLPGGFAESITVPSSNVVLVNSSINPECAALSEPLGCVIHSMDMVNRAPARYGLSSSSRQRARTMLVCGGGPAGLLFVQFLRAVAKYDGVLLVSEPNAMKRALAERWGAETLDPNSGNLTEQIRDRTVGRGIEMLVEASGSGDVFGAIPGLVRKQGTILLYGHGHAGVDLSVMNPVQFLEPTLVSPAGASGGHDDAGRPVTYERALRLIEDGTVDVAPLITHRYNSLDAVPAAFAGDHRRPDYVKGVVLQ